MAKVIIESEVVRTRQGKSQRTGRDYSIRTQQALFDGSRLRGPLELTLGDDQAPYPVGTYELDFEASVVLDRYGSLEFGRLLTLKEVKSNSMAFPKTGTNG